jgi:hypothetical protein
VQVLMGVKLTWVSKLSRNEVQIREEAKQE